MKKFIYPIILVAAIIIAFIAGILFTNLINKNDDLVGVYKTDSWNGKTGTLVLYKDGTCQYPTGNSGTWKVKDDTVIITLESPDSIDKNLITGITIYIDNSLSEVELEELLDNIRSLTNIESVQLNPPTFDNEPYTCHISLSKGESNKETSNKLSSTEGITIINYTYGTKTSTSEHKAKIMENGLVMHDHFFEKVSD